MADWIQAGLLIQKHSLSCRAHYIARFPCHSRLMRHVESGKRLNVELSTFSLGNVKRFKQILLCDLLCTSCCAMLD